MIATSNVHYAAPRDARLAQALAAVRARRSLDEMDGWLAASGAAYLRSGAEMAAPAAPLPRRASSAPSSWPATARSTSSVIAPKLPDFPVPGGHTEATWLRAAGRREGAGALRPAATPSASTGAYAQIARELDVIEDLGFPGYFLIVHDIVRFCEEAGILCQGRGSAANSAVCYALGITSVDPGPARPAVRAVPVGGPGRPARHRPGHRAPAPRGGHPVRLRQVRPGPGGPGRQRDLLPAADGAAGRGPGARLLAGAAGRVGQAGRARGSTGRASRSRPTRASPSRSLALAARMQRLPRHLGIHSGGMVICDRPVGEVCPVEWARMPGRIGAAVGQGRLRLRRAGQVRPARPGHADRAAGLLRAGGGASRRCAGTCTRSRRRTPASTTCCARRTPSGCSRSSPAPRWRPCPGCGRGSSTTWWSRSR